MLEPVLVISWRTDVDQSAACILMSAGKARQLGIPQDQLVYLHGCGDAYESKQPLYRPSMHRSEATRLAGDRTPLPATLVEITALPEDLLCGLDLLGGQGR